LLDKITFGRISRGEPPAFDTRNIYKLSQNGDGFGTDGPPSCGKAVGENESYFAKVERLADRLDRSIKSLLPKRFSEPVKCESDQ
jgi:hypothetical protein